MLIRGHNDNTGRYERKSDSNYGFYNGTGSYYLHDHKPKGKVNILNIAAYTLGIPITAWAIWLNIGGWKADILWMLAAAFWLFKLIRAIINLHYEMKDKALNLKEKQKRIDKEIF